MCKLSLVFVLSSDTTSACGSFKGLHPGITKTLLSRFERKWGKTPDVAQLAHPNVTGNEKGYMSQREREDRVGVVLQRDSSSVADWKGGSECEWYFSQVVQGLGGNPCKNCEVEVCATVII